MVGNAKKTALSNYANTVVDAVVGLIVNPAFLHALGPANFGAWKAMQRLLDVGSSANGGAAQSLKWVIAHRSKSATEDEKRRDVAAALTVLFYWSPILIGVTAAIVVALPALQRNLPADDYGMVYLAGSILGLNVIFMTLAAVPNAVLFGVNEGFRSINITTAVLILTNVGMVAAAVRGFSLPGMAAVMATGTAANGLLTYMVLRRRVNWWGFAKPSKDDITRLSRFSGWVLGWSFVIRLSLATEVIILSAFGGVTLVSSYTFTSYTILFALAICQLTTSSMMPKLGAHIGSKEWDSAQALGRQARELNLALATGTGCLIILFNGSFVRVWAGGSQFMGQNVNIMMVIAFVQFAILRNEAQIVDTGLDIGRKVILGAIMTVGTIAAAGAAFAISKSIVIMYVAIIAARTVGSIGFPLQASRLLRRSDWLLGPTVISVTMLAACHAATKFIHAENLPQLILFTAIAGLVLAPAIFFSTLSRSTRHKILSR